MTRDNSKKRPATANAGPACAIVVGSGRLDKGRIAPESSDLGITSMTRVFAARARETRPARRRDIPCCAGNDVKLAPPRALAPLQSQPYPEAHRAKAATAGHETGPASSFHLLRDPHADNCISTRSRSPQGHPGLAASKAPGLNLRALLRTTS